MILSATFVTVAARPKISETTKPADCGSGRAFDRLLRESGLRIVAAVKLPEVGVRNEPMVWRSMMQATAGVHQATLFLSTIQPAELSIKVPTFDMAP